MLIAFDGEQRTAWFENATKTQQKNEKLARWTGTEVELFARAARASGHSVEEIVRQGAQVFAKRLIANAEIVRIGGVDLKNSDSRKGVMGVRDADHAAAYKALRAEGYTDAEITPYRLYEKAQTNFRSAKRWLEKRGIAYETRKAKSGDSVESV